MSGLLPSNQLKQDQGSRSHQPLWQVKPYPYKSKYHCHTVHMPCMYVCPYILLKHAAAGLINADICRHTCEVLHGQVGPTNNSCCMYIMR